jgi:hypothetical protein
VESGLDTVSDRQYDRFKALALWETEIRAWRLHLTNALDAGQYRGGG